VGLITSHIIALAESSVGTAGEVKGLNPVGKIWTVLVSFPV